MSASENDWYEAEMNAGRNYDDECQHRSVIAVPGGSDCEDCPMTWRPDPNLEDEMAESYFDPDDMYGSYKY